MIKSIESKIQFLLFSFLNSQKFVRGEVTSSILREKIYEHFKDYKPKKDISILEYIHYSKFVVFTLTLGELPDLKQIKVIEEKTFPFYDVEIGSKIRDYLLDFYQDTDFEEFYESVKEEYFEEVKKVQDLLKQININELLNQVWGNSEGEMFVIPMPLANRREGFGPQINGISYQVIGGPYDFNSLQTIIHEASHPRAKAILNDLLPEIDKYENLINGIDFDNLPMIKSYKGCWRIYFEEHLIRAIQHIFINPELGLNTKERIKYEFEIGFIYIYKFEEVLNKYKKENLDFKKIVLEILEKLLEK